MISEFDPKLRHDFLYQRLIFNIFFGKWSSMYYIKTVISANYENHAETSILAYHDELL